jgi:hypothetical protein
MTLIKKRNVPPLEFGRVSTFFDHYKIQLPPSKGFDFTARFNESFLDYYVNQGGCSTVQVNSGSGVYDALPQQYRNTIYHLGSVQAVGGGKPWSQFSTQDATNLANFNWNSLGGVKVVTSNLSEGSDQYTLLYSTNPSAYLAYEKRMDDLATAAGCLNFGSYGGILNPHVENDINAFRQGLLSDAGALAYCQAHESGEAPFWTTNGWDYQHPLMKHYANAPTDLHTSIIKHNGANDLIKGGLRAVGRTDRQLLGYYFQDKQEFLEHPGQGYSEQQITDLGDGIKYYEYTFPGYSGAFMIDEIFFGLDTGDRVYVWEDSSLYSSTPGYVEPNFIQQNPDGGSVAMRSQRVQPFTENNIVQVKPTATKQSLPDPNRPFPYPGVYEGMKDMGPVGAWFYGKAYAWCGGVPISSYNKHRIPGGQWCTDGRGYLADRLEDRKPLARVGRVGNKGFVKIVDYVTESTDPYAMEVDLGGGAIEVFEDVESGSNNFYFFDLAA